MATVTITISPIAPTLTFPPGTVGGDWRLRARSGSAPFEQMTQPSNVFVAVLPAGTYKLEGYRLNDSATAHLGGVQPIDFFVGEDVPIDTAGAITAVQS